MIGAGLIIAIGAQNAFVLAQSIKKEFHWPIALTFMLCDAILIAAGVFGLATLLLQSPVLLSIARWGGVIFLVGYACMALQRAAFPKALDTALPERRPLRAVMTAALAVTLLNPHVYLDTVLLVGALGAQQDSPAAYTLGAMSASCIWFSLLAAGGAMLSKLLAKPRTWRIIDIGVAAMMLSVAFHLVTGD
jgi:L-lysine exporter family protein LysE/ArgO